MDNINEECKMADLQSKMPDFKEISSMAGKLFNDVKTSICEIVKEYKEKHADVESECSSKKSSTKCSSKSEEKKSSCSIDKKEDPKE